MKVIVVGAGVWGLACAKVCAQQGMTVSVFDKEHPGAGASGGIVGALAPYVPDEWNQKKQFQYEALDTAEQFWLDTDQISGKSSGFGRTGRWLPIRSQRALELAHLREKTSTELWRGRYSWAVEPRPDFMPLSMAPFGVTKDTFSARILPFAAIQSLTSACKVLGVKFFNDHAVTALGDNSILGPWGSRTADVVIVSAGHLGFDLLTPFLPHPAGGGVKGQAALLDADLGQLPQINGEGVYIIPHANGTVAVGSTSEKHWTHPTQTDDQLDELITRASQVHPTISAAPVLQRWAGVRPKARRSDLMIGPMPKLKGVFVAAGGFKVGFGLAHKVADTMAQIIRGDDVLVPKNFTVEWHMA